MSGIAIQIREEEKCLAKSHLTEVLKVSSSTISGWMKKGKIPGASGYNGKFTRKDIETIFEILNHKPFIKSPRAIKKEWKGSNFIIKDGGIFWVSPKMTLSEDEWVKDLISEYGIWDGQGMNNHVHIDPDVKNPILQLILSKELIGYWVEQVKEVQPDKKVIIYWNGFVNSLICIYLMPEEGEKFLEKFDKYLGMRKCIISEIEF